jgi:hypothetical protein
MPQRDSNPRSQKPYGQGQARRLRPQGHRDRHHYISPGSITLIILVGDINTYLMPYFHKVHKTDAYFIFQTSNRI